MKSGQYIRTLAEFITGDIELLNFKQLVEERLCELRQKPEMTDEKRFLSSIELYLHEVREGLRDESEVYAHAQFILDNIILKRMTSNDKTEYFSPNLFNAPCFLSSLASPNKKKTKTEDLSLAILK